MLIQVLTSAAAADKEQLLQTKKFFSSIYIRVLKINILLVKFEIFADFSKGCYVACWYLLYKLYVPSMI